MMDQSNTNISPMLIKAASTLVQLDVLHNAEVERWMVLAYELAAALAEEVHYSSSPSLYTLDLLKRALRQFPDTEFAQRYAKLRIDKLQPVD